MVKSSNFWYNRLQSCSGCWASIVSNSSLLWSLHRQMLHLKAKAVLKFKVKVHSTQNSCLKWGVGCFTILTIIPKLIYWCKVTIVKKKISVLSLEDIHHAHEAWRVEDCLYSTLTHLGCLFSLVSCHFLGPKVIFWRKKMTKHNLLSMPQRWKETRLTWDRFQS